MNSGVRAIATNEDQPSTSIAFGSAALAAGVVIVWAVLPRILPRSKRALPKDLVLGFHWTYASMPCLLGVVAVVAGSATWAYWFGLAVSIGLLVLTTRGIRKERTRARR